MKTKHLVHLKSSQSTPEINSETVDIVVTSPPYPMIEMWDECFSQFNPNISDLLQKKPNEAFTLMHLILDEVWEEMFRVLKPGGFLCINIGDATRSINKNFQLFSNHSRILSKCLDMGFQNLPNIIWRKQTNAPNKFMGSGMLPSGAYVTLEHEYILVFRKAGKRVFKSEAEKEARRKSAYFWEERNQWFSDVWDFKGTAQRMNGGAKRKRSGAFPLELPLRLISMYSLYGDIVLDPFLGTGTTMHAAMMTGRNSIGYEIDSSVIGGFSDVLSNSFRRIANSYTTARVSNHLDFVDEYSRRGKVLKHHNYELNFPVMTRQESQISLYAIDEITTVANNEYHVSYKPPVIEHQMRIFD